MKDKLINIVLLMQIIVTAIVIIPNDEQYNIIKIYTLLICGAALLILMLANYKKLKFMFCKKRKIIISNCF